MANITNESPTLYYLCRDDAPASAPVYRVVHETTKFIWYAERARYGVGWDPTIKQKSRDNLWPNKRREVADVDSELAALKVHVAGVREAELECGRLLESLKYALRRYNPCTYATEQDMQHAQALQAALQAALDAYKA